jgi:HSP20 family protein
MTNIVKSNGNLRDLFFPELPALFDDSLMKDFFHAPAGRSTALPAVNIKENDQTYEIDIAVPGMDKKDFKVELKDNRLTISARKENKNEESDSSNRYVRREFSYQSFTRSFTLPEHTVESDNISATYTDGILNITVPKKEKTAGREIQIS